jgi:hypothetical protein
MSAMTSSRARHALILVVLSGALAFPSLTAAAFEASARETLARQLSAAGEQTQRALDRPGAQLSLRTYSNAALIALVIENDPAKAAHLLETVLDAQDPATGQLPWLQPGSRRMDDTNAIEFATQAWGPLLLGFADRLPAGLRERLSVQAKAALPALAGNNPPVAYTNIYLMNAVNRLLISQAVRDETAVRQARARLEAWRETARTVGVREFGSPVYYTTDLNSLVAGYLYATDQKDKELFRGMLDFFWSDIAAHTLQGKLVGPHSRDVDFAFGEGPLNTYLGVEGWRPMDEQARLNPEMVLAFLNMSPQGYRVSPDIAALAQRRTRTVLARWGSETGQTRNLFIEGGAAIGSVGSGNLSSTDKVFAIDLRRDMRRSITMSFLPTVGENPLGERRRVGLGHNKPWHPPLNGGMVQRNGWVLGSFDLNPSRERERGGAAFSTSLLLPRDAESISLDGRRFAGQDLQGNGHSVIAVRDGDRCAAVRLIRADAQGQIVLTGEGGGSDTLRLVIPQDPQSQRSQIAFLARAGRCDAGTQAEWVRQVASAPVQDSTDRDTWSLGTTVEGSALSLRRSLRSRRVTDLRGGDSAANGPTLSINGEDLTTPLRR